MFAVLVLMGCSSEKSRTESVLLEGVTYSVYKEDGNIIHVIAMARPLTVTLNVIKAGRSLKAIQPLSEIVRSKNPIAAINGDFFLEDGIPSGALMESGTWIKEGSESWSAIALDEKGNPEIGAPQFSGEILVRNKKVSIDGINRTRRENETVLYNSFFGNSTGTNSYGMEITLKPKSFHKDTMLAYIVDIDSTGNHAVSDSTWIISIHGQLSNSNFRLGENLQIILPARGIKNMIGGYPVLVKNKKSLIDASMLTKEFVTNKNARTAVGYNSQTIFLVCVDGRQPNYSSGMSLPELADWLIVLGCESALNLDGGGSTTMWIKGKIVNRPSDGGLERLISTALMVSEKI